MPPNVCIDAFRDDGLDGGFARMFQSHEATGTPGAALWTQCAQEDLAVEVIEEAVYTSAHTGCRHALRET